MDCRVVVEAAVPVYDVGTADEAVRIAISKTGEMLNPDLNYVEIEMGERHCPHCGDDLEPAFIAADEGLVALHLEMDVFNVEQEEHASRIARKEIGQRLQDIPLEVVTVEETTDGTDADDEGDSDEVGSDEATADAGTDRGGDGAATSTEEDESATDAVPEFEDLLDDE